MESYIIIAILGLYLLVIKIKNNISKNASDRLIASQRELIDSQRRMIEVLKQTKSIVSTPKTYREHMTQLVKNAKSNLN